MAVEVEIEIEACGVVGCEKWLEWLQQAVLLPEKFNLSLGLDLLLLLLLNRLDGRITSTDKTSNAMMLRPRTCRRIPHRWINLPLRSGPIAEVPVRIHGRDEQVNWVNSSK